MESPNSKPVEPNYQKKEFQQQESSVPELVTDSVISSNTMVPVGDAITADKTEQVSVTKEDSSGKTANFLVKYFRKKTKGLSRTQISILCIFPFVEFFAATVISIQGPFYPQVARSKGASSTEYGLVFGIFEIMVFIMAPIYGAKMGQWSPHRLFNEGIFTTSITCIIFGFLHHLEGRVFFISMSLIVRTIEAIGDAAFVTASFSLIAAEFPDSVATTFAMMETFYGLGMIAGPTVGGALYQVGGFTLPFAVMGGLLFISAIATYAFITKTSTPDLTRVVASSSFAMFKMLSIPAIALTAYGTFAAASGIGFLSANLQHHLEQFGLNELQVGSVFMLNGGVYALTAPFWGKLIDKTSQPKIFSLIGSLLTIAGFILVGPLPFFSWSPSLLIICIGLVIFGLGLGSTLVSAFILFLQDAIATGHPENVTTHGLVSGLWTSMTALGFFVGPTVGGILDDLVGFRWGTLFILLQQLILMGILAYYFSRVSSKAPSDNENELKEVACSTKLENTDKTTADYKLSVNSQDVLISQNEVKCTGVINPNFVVDK